MLRRLDHLRPRLAWQTQDDVRGNQYSMLLQEPHSSVEVSDSVSAADSSECLVMSGLQSKLNPHIQTTLSIPGEQLSFALVQTIGPCRDDKPGKSATR
jgi:hypothetical protein